MSRKFGSLFSILNTTLFAISLSAAEIHFDETLGGEEWFIPQTCSASADFIAINVDEGKEFCEVSVPAEDLRGNFVEFSGEAKFSGSGTAKIEIGICENGETILYSTKISDSGKFEKVKVSAFISDSKFIDIRIGIDGGAGTLCFRKPNFSAKKIWAPQLPKDFKCEYTSRFKIFPTMRGAMGALKKPSDDDLRELAGWGANLMRYQIAKGGAVFTDAGKYLDFVDSKVDEILSLSPFAQRLGIKFAVDMHLPIGGNGDRDFPMFQKRGYAEAYVEVWRRTASKLRGNPSVWAYNLMNEPAQLSPAKSADWLEMQWLAAKAIREIDPKTPIVVNGASAGAPSGFKHLTPFPLKDIIYQAHMYMPMDYTHQGVAWINGRMAYPSKYKGKVLDKKALEKYLEPITEFQKKWGARIYIGEFVAIRWAQGADRYFADCIDIFEKHGWNWSYHAFREWQGWDVELNEDEKNPQEKNFSERKKVLMEAFKKNIKN